MADFAIDKYNVHDFPIGNKTEGKTQTICVFCSSTRKKKKEKCVSIDLDTGKFNCSHCGEKGNLHTYVPIDGEGKPSIKREYSKPIIPEKQNVTKLDDGVVDWFSKRGITQDTLMEFGIMNAVEWMPQINGKAKCILFPYYENGEIVNIKYRTKEKHFKMSKGAKLIPFNLDKALEENPKQLVWVEGECDAMAVYQSGIKNVVSVPNGATISPKEVEEFKETGDIKEPSNINFEWLDNVYDKIKDVEEHIIAGDNDAAGYKLKKELKRRLGSEICKDVYWGKYKDANQAMVEDFNPNFVVNAIKSAKQSRVEGITFVDDLQEDMLRTFNNGKVRGSTTHVKTLDQIWKWRIGDTNLFTGYNNEGKGTLLRGMCMYKAVYDDWKFGVFSPEDLPESDFYDDLISAYIGKPTEQWFKNRMTESEYIKGMKFVGEHFFLINDENPTIDNLIPKVKYLVKAKGITWWIIDNLISMERDGNIREDLFAGRLVRKMKKLCVQTGTGMHLVAHQQTPEKNKDGQYPKPHLYAIKGGGSFADTIDHSTGMWKPNRATDSSDPNGIFYSDKLRKKRLMDADTGEVHWTYNLIKNRFDWAGCGDPLDKNNVVQATMDIPDQKDWKDEIEERDGIKVQGEFYKGTKESLDYVDIDIPPPFDDMEDDLPF